MNDKTRILFELGEVDHNADWPDYLQYGFDESDVDALMALVADEALDEADQGSNEVWAPLHAWRALGQIGSDRVVSPLLEQFDRLREDDWALPEIPMVMGMIGASAIPVLADYLNESYHDEFARVMAADGLCQIARMRPEHRAEVVDALRNYIADPDVSARFLNGLTVSYLLDLDAVEAIDDIRDLFAKHCVEITCNGDLEEVELELGVRSERSTPKPDFMALEEQEQQAWLENLDIGADDIYRLIDDKLMQYGSDESVLDVSELDGFFAALACAPDVVLPSQWLPAMWGGEALMPEWESRAEVESFSRSMMALHEAVMEGMNRDDYGALFLERTTNGRTYTVVDEWCNGFLRGMSLWGPLSAADAAFTEDCLQQVRLFATDAGYRQLESMTDDEVEARQQQIEPDVRRLFQHFVAQRRPAPHTPMVRTSPKIGRNAPCPCGSGKKYKKCCLH
ncbi:MAG: UPF0149 family protein [Gammaproteobacteria bacterium]|jgi:uncharacterized protein